MNYKKLISFIVCMVILFSFSACQTQPSEQQPSEQPQSKEDTQCWMPYGLKFGMTYDEFSQQLTKMGIPVPALSPADSNAGFVAESIHPDLNDSSVWEFLESPALKKLADEEPDETADDFDFRFANLDYTYSDPAFYFSFNQDQKLYEFGCFWSCFTENLPSYIAPEIIANYTAKLGAAESTSDFSGTWNTKEHKVSLDYSSEDSLMILYHHCTTYNLDS